MLLLVANKLKKKKKNLCFTDCKEAKDDDDATRLTKQLLTVICRKALGSVDQNYCTRSLAEIVKRMDRDKRRDHLYVYGLYELAIEQIGRTKVSASYQLIRPRVNICIQVNCNIFNKTSDDGTKPGNWYAGTECIENKIHKSIGKWRNIQLKIIVQ